MDATVRALLNENQLTLAQVAAKTKISVSTLSAAFKRPVDTWSVRVLRGLADVLMIDTDTLLNKIAPRKFELKVDREARTIQGVPIPAEYFHDVYAAVRFNVMEGWRPTADDIRRVTDRVVHPDAIVDEEITNAWKRTD